MEDWYAKQLEEYRNDGKSDAEKGEVSMPYPLTEDPMDEDANEAYKAGFFARRKELGAKFKWAGK